MAKGGFSSIRYAFRVAAETGMAEFLKAITSKNACKTCAYGMGGQKGGMRNEAGNFPEICKKSMQALLTDIQKGISDSFFTVNSISDLKKLSPRQLERLGRLNSPLWKGAGERHYQAITWEKALTLVAHKMKSTLPDRTFFYSSGRSSNEAAFLLHLFARLYGTNNVNNCSYYCHQASGVGLNATIGTGTATIELTDLKAADLIFVIGANPSSNHPRFLTELLHCRRRGGKVVIINPIEEPGLVKFSIPSDMRSLLSGGSEIASHYLQPNIGGDIALLKALALLVLEKKMENREFIREFTVGFEAFEADLKKDSIGRLAGLAGVPVSELELVAKVFCQAKNVVFTWAMGLTHHLHGVENVEAIVNLALLRGMIGRKNAGLLPLRGHSNVQGVGSVGVTPVLKEQIFQNIERHFSIQLPAKPGLDTMACMESAARKEMDFAFLLGGNLFGSNPDSHFAENALNAIPFKVFVNTTLNTGHLFGVEGETVIFPCSARDEEMQTTTQESMFNYVRISEGGIKRLFNAKAESSILAELAMRVLPDSPVPFQDFLRHENLRKAIAATIPGFENLENTDRSKEEFTISGRILHQPKFNTPDGKARFSVIAVPSIAPTPGHFNLMTIRSEGQFNTIIYDEDDLFRNQTHRWVVLMNPADIQSLGCNPGDLVDLSSETGRMEQVSLQPFNIRKGNLAAYFPEANVLIPKITDPRSKTPSFKRVEVSVTKSKKS